MIAYANKILIHSKIKICQMGHNKKNSGETLKKNKKK